MNFFTPIAIDDFQSPSFSWLLPSLTLRFSLSLSIVLTASKIFGYFERCFTKKCWRQLSASRSLNRREKLRQIWSFIHIHCSRLRILIRASVYTLNYVIKILYVSFKTSFSMHRATCNCIDLFPIMTINYVRNMQLI